MDGWISHGEENKSRAHGPESDATTRKTSELPPPSDSGSATPTNPALGRMLRQEQFHAGAATTEGLVKQAQSTGHWKPPWQLCGRTMSGDCWLRPSRGLPLLVSSLARSSAPPLLPHSWDWDKGLHLVEVLGPWAENLCFHIVPVYLLCFLSFFWHHWPALMSSFLASLLSCYFDS